MAAFTIRGDFGAQENEACSKITLINIGENKTTTHLSKENS